MMAGFGQICAALATIGCLYLMLVIACVLGWRARKPHLRARPEPVSLLKPLHGHEPKLIVCLRSFCEQRYGAPFEIIFGLQNGNDPARVTVQMIKAKFPDLPIALVVDDTEHGTNAKVSNLVNMERAAAHDIIIAADSDILVRPDHLEKTVALLQEPGVGAVSALYCGTAAAGVWSSLSAHCINVHFLPSVLFALRFKLAKPCFGSTIALKRSTLKAIGGFKALANQLADDYAIGEAVRQTGQSVEVGSLLARHVCSERSARELFSHQLRWARTIKTIDLPGYVGSIISHPFALASLGTAAGNSSCVTLAALALCLRIGLIKLLERRFELEKQSLWLIPAACWMLFGVYIWAFFGTAVTWKRTIYRVGSGGVLMNDQG